MICEWNEAGGVFSPSLEFLRWVKLPLILTFTSRLAVSFVPWFFAAVLLLFLRLIFRRVLLRSTCILIIPRFFLIWRVVSWLGEFLGAGGLCEGSILLFVKLVAVADAELFVLEFQRVGSRQQVRANTHNFSSHRTGTLKIFCQEVFCQHLQNQLS